MAAKAHPHGQAPGEVSETTLGALKADPHNARKHNPRNVGMIVDSLQQLGAARSIVVDENNVVLAGNGVVEAAGEAGLERVIVVEATGNEIVAVRRRGLTQRQKVDLALRDNRANELSEWDTEVLRELSDEMDLSHLFNEQEWSEAIGEQEEGDIKVVNVKEPPKVAWFLIAVPLSKFVDAQEAIATLEGMSEITVQSSTTDDPRGWFNK